MTSRLRSILILLERRAARSAATESRLANGTSTKVPSDRHLWWAVVASCLGVLMISIDTTVVNVALPSIGSDLRFPASALAWIVDAYLTTYGGFLILSGRLADLLGHRRTFLASIAFFTLASLACALARSPGTLVAARALQGVAGALVASSALPLTTNIFQDARRRAQALGARAFALAAGSGTGLLLGGFLTTWFSWQSVFLINVPIGVGVYALCVAVIPADECRAARAHFDIAGAAAITSSAMLVLYATTSVESSPWSWLGRLVALTGAGTFLALFLAVEGWSKDPVMPPTLFRTPHFRAANLCGALFSAATFSWYFGCALYLQLVLDLEPMRVGLAFLPANLLAAVISIAIVPRIVTALGIRRVFLLASLMSALGLLVLARVPPNGCVLTDVLPSMLLLGIGSGMASSPLLLSALGGVSPRDAGVASGVFGTCYTLGGAVGLSVLANIAAARAENLRLAGIPTRMALNSGYHAIFSFAAGLALLAALIGGSLLRLQDAAANIPGRAMTDCGAPERFSNR